MHYREHINSFAGDVQTIPVNGNKAKAAAEHEQFLAKVLRVFESKLDQDDFTIDHLAKAMFMSRSQIFRKTNEAVGITPNELLRMYRFKRAAHLLKADEMNITQVMCEIGLRNPSYFAATFRKYFGLNPSNYRELHSER